MTSIVPKKGAQFFMFMAPARALHRAPDYQYMQIWKKSGGSFGIEPAESASRMYQSPKLVEEILRVQTAMKERGYIPFLHAMPASSKLVMKFAEILYQNTTIEKIYFKYLRTKNDIFTQNKETITSISVIQETEMKQQQSSRLSMSYALTSGIENLESAASWGFVNHFGKEQYFAVLNHFKSLGIEKVIGKHPSFPEFMEKANALIRRYNRLEVGDFIVLGIPCEKVSKYVYDSKPFNIPTGKKALEVAENPEKHVDSLFKNRTHMATMLINNETLDPDSGIIMVDARDEGEQYCSGFSTTPMKEIEIYKGLVSSVDTRFEKEQMEKRKKIDAELESFIQQFKEMVLDPKSEPDFSLNKEDDFDSFECPDQLP